MKDEQAFLRQKIKRLYRSALLSILAIGFLSALITIGHLNLSRAYHMINKLELAHNAELELLNETLERVRFVLKYNTNSESVDGFFQETVQKLAKNFEDIEAINKDNLQLIKIANENFIISYLTNYDAHLITPPEAETRLKDWASSIFNYQQSTTNPQFLSFVGPLEMGLLNRSTWIERNMASSQHLIEVQARLTQWQQWSFLASLISVLALLIFIFIFILLPSIRQALFAEQESRLRARIRETLTDLYNLVATNQENFEDGWDKFIDMLQRVMRNELPEISLTISKHNDRIHELPGQKKNKLYTKGPSVGDANFTVAIDYDDDMNFVRDELKALSEKVLALVLLSHNVALRLRVETDRDAYFNYADAAVRNSPIGLALFDASGKLLLANALFEKDLESVFEFDVLDVHLDRLVNFSKSYSDCGLCEFFSQNQSNIIEQDHDDQIIRWQRVALPEGGTLMAVQNITKERRKIENAEHTRRLEALGKISSGISHDVNNFLSVILNNVELAQISKRKTDRDEFLSRAINACIDASKVNEQLLSYSRRQPLLPQSVKLEDVMDQLKSYGKQCNRENDLKISADGSSSIWADKSNLFSATLNLLKNALEASRPGDPIYISFRDFLLEDRTPAVELIIEDRGRGFDGETEKYLEPFFTTKEQGSGLGLSAVEGFIAQSNGKFEFGNNPKGQGAFAKLILPASQSNLLPLEDAKNYALGSKSDARILLVDDNPSVLQSLNIQLTRAGFSTLAVKSLSEAHEATLKQNNQFSLLITDIVLGDGTGFTVAKDFVKRNPTAKVIYISGHPSAEFENDILEFPGAFLTKPFRMAELHLKVSEALSERVA